MSRKMRKVLIVFAVIILTLVLVAVGYIAYCGVASKKLLPELTFAEREQLIIFGLLHPVEYANVTRAIAEYTAGNFSNAFVLVQPAAQDGSSGAEYFLGTLYHEGKAMPKDDQMAFSWLEKAAEKGWPDAEAAIAHYYFNGVGVKKSLEEGEKWTTKAVIKNNALAEADLSYMYLEGIGVEKNYEKALQLGLKSAEQGNAVGQYNTAGMFRVYEKDNVSAYKWLSLSAQQNHEAAQKELSELSTHMTPDQIAEGKRLAAEFQPIKHETPLPAP